MRRRRCSCRCLTSRCHSPNASRRTDVAVVRPSSVSAPFCRARRAFVACTVCAHRVYHTRVAPRFVCDRKIDIAWRRARAPFCSCMCRSHDAKASRCRAVPDVRVSSENAMACDASRRRRSAARAAAKTRSRRNAICRSPPSVCPNSVSAMRRFRAAVLRCAACRCSRPNASRIAPFAVEPISASAIVRRRLCI